MRAQPSASQPAPSAAVRSFLVRKPRLLINGEWVDPRTDKTIAVFDPATGRAVANVADAGTEDVNRAGAAARGALEGSQ
jgi:phenylacetaldehyde dehydrogenase